jgi:Cu-processing system permease protein
MELLFSQPLSRAEVVVGKLLGVFLSIAMATLLGFTVAGVLVVAGHGPEGLARYAAMVGFSLLLALAFLSLALLVATVAHRKPPAIGVSLFLWFFFVLFYDILAIALTLFLRGESANVAIFLSVFGNPVDMVRVATLVMLDNVTIFGAAGAAMLRFLGGTATAIAAVLAALLLWILIPVGISCGILGGQDI